MPKGRSPSSASRESFTTPRRYLAFACTAIGGSLGRLAVGRPEREPLEPPDAHVLAGGGCDPGHELADGLRGIPDVGLPEKVLHVLWIHRRDLHRDLLGEAPEVRISSHEVGLARELDHRADAAAGVDVGLDDPFLRLTVGLLLHLLESAGLDDLLGLLEVALRLVEGPLAVHDARTGLLAQALDIVFGHHSSSFFSATLSGSSAGSSKRWPPIGYSSSSSGSYTRGVRLARGTPSPPSYCSGVVEG